MGLFSKIKNMFQKTEETVIEKNEVVENESSFDIEEELKDIFSDSRKENFVEDVETKKEEVKKSVKVGLFMDIGIAIVMSVVLIVARVPLFGIFCDDAVVVEIGAHMLFLLTPFYCVYVFTEIYSGALRGMGDVVVPMVITMFGVCVVRVLWIMIVAGAFPTLEVVIFNYPVTWILSAAAFIIYYRYKIKKIEAIFKK